MFKRENNFYSKATVCGPPVSHMLSGRMIRRLSETSDNAAPFRLWATGSPHLWVTGIPQTMVGSGDKCR